MTKEKNKHNASTSVEIEITSGRRKKPNDTKKITTIAMLSALAYIIMAIGRIPITSFLDYDPKDVIIVIGGFLMGPMTSLIISFLVSLVEMFTVSDTGIIGFLMNFIASATFACGAAYIYKKRHNLKGALIGLTFGVISMTLVMLLWNYLLTPIFMGVPREAVVEMMVPVLLPFNLFKGGINMGITLLIYRPISYALRKSGLIEAEDKTKVRKTKMGMIVIGLGILSTCILGVLVWKGII